MIKFQTLIHYLDVYVCVWWMFLFLYMPALHIYCLECFCMYRLCIRWSKIDSELHLVRIIQYIYYCTHSAAPVHSKTELTTNNEFPPLSWLLTSHLGPMTRLETGPGEEWQLLGSYNQSWSSLLEFFPHYIRFLKHYLQFLAFTLRVQNIFKLGIRSTY